VKYWLILYNSFSGTQTITEFFNCHFIANTVKECWWRDHDKNGGLLFWSLNRYAEQERWLLMGGAVTFSYRYTAKRSIPPRPLIVDEKYQPVH